MAQQYRYGYLWRVCIVAAMGGLLFGYDWVVIGGAKAFYEPYFQLTDSVFWQGFAMSTALFGCILGAIVSGALSDRWGRKRLLVLAGFLFTWSAAWTALASSFALFNLARFLGGVAIGLASNLSPMYIAEISPAEQRGRLVSINQLTIVIGILTAQLLNWWIAEPVPSTDQLRWLLSSDREIQDVLGSEAVILRQGAERVVDQVAFARVAERFPDFTVAEVAQAGDSRDARVRRERAVMDAYLLGTWNGQRGWRWMFGAEVVPALSFFLLMFFVPESPRWLIKSGQDGQAEAILRKVGGADYARLEVADVKSTLNREEIVQVRYRDLLEPKLLRIVALGMFLAVFQQWSGINVIFNYAQEVFQAAGYEVGELMFSIVVTGIVNLVFTFVAIFTVDRVGRRFLMLIGSAGLAAIYAVLGTGYYLQSTGIHMLILVVTAIACYAMSLAPVTWVVISELFPNRIRGAAMSIAVFSLWCGCAALTFSFPLLNRTLGAHGVFWLYGVICLVGSFVVLAKLPETKGKSLEDIERQLVD